jgi:hypothetical protein
MDGLIHDHSVFSSCVFQIIFKFVNQFLTLYVNIFFFLLEFSYILGFPL